jgi:pimeloyl-ACP methyl ester carboxylesterase
LQWTRDINFLYKFLKHRKGLEIVVPLDWIRPDQMNDPRSPGLNMHLSLWAISPAAILVTIGCIYQLVGCHSDRRRYAGAGRWIKVGKGHSLYLLEQGNGGPAVIFESGIGATNLNWRHVQGIVSRFTATASYDRAGLGFSSPCRSARTPGNIAAELHEMLQRANIKPPYILVGHSFGGLVVRRYALLYPKDVAGVVLVDPMRCEEWPPLDPSKQSQINLGRRLIRYAVPIAFCGVARLAVRSAFRRGGVKTASSNPGKIGGRHVIHRLTQEVGKMPREVWPVVAAHWSTPGFYAGMRSHIKSIPDTVKEMHKAEPIHRIPVRVLTPGKSKPLSESCLRSIGTNVEQVIAGASEHWIHLDEPELVISAIRELVTARLPETVGVTA